MWFTILAVAQLIYVAVLATWILFEKRTPIATLAWILSLIALPYVGLILFFLLGPRRMMRKRLRHKRARAAVATKSRVGMRPSDPPTVQDDPRVAQLVRLVRCAGEPPATQAESVDVFHDTSLTYDAIEAAIANATHHVHLNTYIFDPRRSGHRFRDALIARAKDGVVVRVLVDAVGSSDMTNAFVAPMREAGILFARFNPVSFARLFHRVDFRNHRKVVVCDGTVGFTGGVNISDDYLPRIEAEPFAGRGHSRRRRKPLDSMGPWRDTHARITGDAVRWLQLTFLDDWYYATGYVARDEAYFPTQTRTGNHLVQIVASGPDRDVEAIQKLYFAAITMARERVYITTPYFVPDDAILAALITTAMRGVDVRLLVPRRSDSLIVTAAARSYYDALLAAGVRIYEYQPSMIHSKTLAVDDFFAAVGTANMDNRSFRLNFEVSAVFYGPADAGRLVTHFMKDLALAAEIRPTTRQAVSLVWRASEAAARLLSPLL